MATLLAQSDQAEPLVRALWGLLLLTIIGLFGVIMLLLARRAYRRHANVSGRESPGVTGASTDVWAESARRMPEPDDALEDDDD
ncbi:MAG: hypothetical protein ACF8GE_01055 [Phycisphaerales bacterium JB043]